MFNQNDKYDVIIFGGQSNMQGQTETLSESEIVKDAYEYKYLSNTFSPLRNPVGENITYALKEGYQAEQGKEADWIKEHALGGACYGFTNMVPSFCRSYIKKTGRKVIAVHAAKGSTCIADWLDGTLGFNALTAKACACLKQIKNINKVFFVWLQGESDAIGKTTAFDYKEKLSMFNKSLKALIPIEKFAIIKVGKFTFNDNDVEIQRAQEEICTSDGDFFMLTRITETMFSDNTYLSVWGHYNAKGQELIGSIGGESLADYAVKMF